MSGNNSTTKIITMSFQAVFVQFWEKVKESIENGTYAKLTLAKTIGDTELKNIYVRPVLLENDVFSLSLSAKYKTEELESFHTLDEAFLILAPYMANPFLTALLFTTENDITFKLNKKRVASIIEQAPTFKSPSDVIIEMKAKGISI
ncbi:MAG: hypothetical protein ACI9M1_000369 [Porticoccaceae bacterium]|jgi:hypothetical protein